MIQSSFIIYTQANRKCGWCEKAAEALDKRGLPYMLRPLTLEKLRDVANRANMTTVPIIYHGVRLIGGHDELVEYLDAIT